MSTGATRTHYLVKILPDDTHFPIFDAPHVPQFTTVILYNLDSRLMQKAAESRRHQQPRRTTDDQRPPFNIAAFRPSGTAAELRCDFEHRTPGRRVISKSCPVETAVPAEDHPGVGVSPLLVRERVQQGLFPSTLRGGCQLEYCPVILGPAVKSRAVEISHSVQHHAARGAGSVLAVVFKRMDHSLRPASILVRLQCKDRTAAMAATAETSAFYRRAIEIPGRIQNQAGKRVAAVFAVAERMDDALRPASIAVRR